MIFIDNDKTRGRMTAPERENFRVESHQLGVDLNKPISEGTALGMVLQKLSNRSPAHAGIVKAIFDESKIDTGSKNVDRRPARKSAVVTPIYSLQPSSK